MDHGHATVLQGRPRLLGDGADIAAVGGHVQTSGDSVNVITSSLESDLMIEPEFRKAAAEIISSAEKENGLHGRSQDAGS